MTRLALAAALLAAISARAAAEEAIVRPADALQHLGEAAVVEGMLDSVVCSPQACLLSFEPGFSGLVAAIPGEVVAAFGDPEARFEGHRVRLHGTIVERAGRPRMELRDPHSIEVLDAGSASAASAGAPPGSSGGAAAPAARGSGSATVANAPAGGDRDAAIARATAPQAPLAPGEVRVDVAGAPPGRALSAREAAARLGLDAARPAPQAEGAAVQVTADEEVRMLRAELTELRSHLASIEDAVIELQDRVASVEQATDENALALRQRASAQEARSAYVASSGVDPSSLHRVGRGWSAKGVLRFLGEPQQVSGNPPGPYTWIYPGGRMLTIDGRGRVVSAVGF